MISSRTRILRHYGSQEDYGRLSGGIAVGDTVEIPSPIFFTGLGFIIGGLFWPAITAGSAKLSDIAVGRVSGRH